MLPVAAGVLADAEALGAALLPPPALGAPPQAINKYGDHRCERTGDALRSHVAAPSNSANSTTPRMVGYS
jgi:hypothetical protein